MLNDPDAAGGGAAMEAVLDEMSAVQFVWKDNAVTLTWVEKLSCDE